MAAKRKKNKGFSRGLKITLYGIAVLIFVCMCLVVSIGMGSAVKNRTELFIPTGATYRQVVDSVRHSGNMKMLHFKVMAQVKSYPELVKPGRYVLQRGITAGEAINKLRAGKQDEIKLTFNKVRTLPQLAGIVARQIEADSESIVALLRNEAFLEQFGFPASEKSAADAQSDNFLPIDSDKLLACFIPNTYYFFWNTSAEAFFRRMFYEQDKFWNDFRRGQAAAMGMNRLQVITLASIVEEETLQNDEKPDVASVYLNRLRIGMPLQADPTVKFAVGDFKLRRIKKEHLQYDSPYNTYRRKGLMPGPICTPSAASIDAVLQNKQTKYLYFCARPTFDGHHNFAANYTQHKANARAYQKELNARGIK